MSQLIVAGYVKYAKKMQSRDKNYLTKLKKMYCLKDSNVKLKKSPNKKKRKKEDLSEKPSWNSVEKLKNKSKWKHDKKKLKIWQLKE